MIPCARIWRASGLGLNGLMEAAAAVALACTAAGFLGRWGWAFDLASQFRVHYFAGLAVLALLFAARRRTCFAAACGVGAVLNLIPILPQLLPVHRAARPEPERVLRVLCLNVHTSNQSYPRVLDLIRREQPDVVALLEVDDGWETALEPLRQTHPHHLIDPRADNFGIALFSRHPLLDAAILNLGDSDLPTIRASLDAPGGPVDILVTHPLPPISPAAAESRDAQLCAAAAMAANRARPCLIVGDLNTTPWSHVFRSVLRLGQLQDTSVGGGLSPTWPASLILLGIPIDHVLASPEFQVVDRRVGPEVGSDHRPLIVDLALPPRRDAPPP